MKKLSENLILMNLLILIFVWLPAVINKNTIMMYYTISFLYLSSTVIIYVLLKRINRGIQR